MRWAADNIMVDPARIAWALDTGIARRVLNFHWTVPASAILQCSDGGFPQSFQAAGLRAGSVAPGSEEDQRLQGGR